MHQSFEHEFDDPSFLLYEGTGEPESIETFSISSLPENERMEILLSRQDQMLEKLDELNLEIESVIEIFTAESRSDLPVETLPMNPQLDDSKIADARKAA